MSETQETPEGLHRREYALHIIESLCWPRKTNLEMFADCLESLCSERGKKLTPKQAHDYMMRAIRLAKEQCVKVDHFFFSSGEYMNMRPAKPDAMPTIDRKKLAEQKAATAREQASPEWQALSEQARQKWREIAGIKVMDVKHTKEELLAQAERLGRR